jgi:hypothetical protein
MKARWLISLAGVVILGVVAAWKAAEASYFAWDLSNGTPTASIRDSELYRVFERRVSVSPTEFELAGRRHRIKDAWLEHRTVPRRVSVFSTRQEVLPELVLCIDLGREGTQADVWFKGGKHSRIFYSGVNGVRMTEVGIAAPAAFALHTRDGRFEAQFEVR